MTTLHSLLPPSSASRRVACPGSRAMEAPFKDQEQSPAAREGEAAHFIAAHILRGVVYRTPALLDINGMFYNGEPFTDEMIEGAYLYANTINTVFSDIYNLHIEERLDIPNIHPDCFGTPDCWFFRENTLYLFDYKFGHGYVEVFENWQLIEYAAGLLQDNKNIDVIMTIVQPRSYDRFGQVRTWKTNDAQLKPYFDRLREAEEKAARPYANCYVSSECRYCLARHVCPTLEQASMAVIDESYLSVPRQLAPNELGRQLTQLERAADILNSRITGLTEEITSTIRRGERVPGYTLEPGKSREIWSAPHAEIVALGELFNIPLIKETPITPLQAIKAGIPADVINAHTESVNGSVKLAKTETKARKVFGY